MYFEDTGEFWILHGSCVGITSGTGQRVVDLTQVFGQWSAVLRRANWVLDHFGALAARRVEVGVTGFEGVCFPGGWETRPPARRAAMLYSQKGRDWSNGATQEAFVIEALARIFDLFSLPRRAPAEAEMFVRNNDFERQRYNPFG